MGWGLVLGMVNVVIMLIVYWVGKDNGRDEGYQQALDNQRALWPRGNWQAQIIHYRREITLWQGKFMMMRNEVKVLRRRVYALQHPDVTTVTLGRGVPSLLDSNVASVPKSNSVESKG